MTIAPSSPAIAEAAEEIMSTYRSLLPRPSIDEASAAAAVIATSDTEEEAMLEELSRQVKPTEVPDELFSVMQEARRNAAQLLAHEQRREALRVLELDRRFRVFEEIIQRASKLIYGDGMEGFAPPLPMEKEAKWDSDVPKDLDRGFSHILNIPSGEYTEKLSLINMANLIETLAKEGGGVLDLQGKLMDQIEWLPTSLGKLQDLNELNLSENQIVTLPPTIGSLRFLTKLDIHSNQLIILPDSFGELSSLIELDLRGNKLKELPDSIGDLANLANLDLSCNLLSILPDSLGKLTKLRRLILETNELEELPYTIGSCICLVELRLDFNHLKALPEAIGRLESLEILALHYNRIKTLPTTMARLYKLKELDASFNELESVPESLCFATNLVKLNVGRNFADLTSLPGYIGNLENLEELDISSNQIRVLPNTFRYLSNLRVLHADETPLEVPPREIVKLGAQAVVEYMADLFAAKQVSSMPAEREGFWSWICSMFQCFSRNKISVAQSSNV